MRERGRFGVSVLDVKLGMRALVRHPGLTVAAILALAVGIPIGMAPIHLSDALEAPLPEDDGNRIRAVRFWDTEQLRGRAPGYFEYSNWLDLDAFETLGAFRRETLGIVTGEAPPVPVHAAEVTASSFAMIGAAPFMGRLFTSEDEQPGAPRVALLSYDLWQAGLAGDPGVIGRAVRVGQSIHTVVGVMPPGFRFPSSERLWVPLEEEFAVEPGRGLDLFVFGRLAAGVRAEAAQAEAQGWSRDMESRFPEQYQQLEVEVVPFGIAAMGLPGGGAGAAPGFFLFRALCLVLLLVSCANVAMLILARATTRLRELAIRTALGAGRARIVSQMFAESLVLTVVGAGFGLAVYDQLLGRLVRALAEAEWLPPLPYWFDLGVTPWTVIWAMGFAVAAAAVVGTIPALKVTGRKVQPNLANARGARAGGGYGGLTGVLIVADVAVAVAAVCLGVGLWDRVEGARASESGVGIAAAEFLAVELTLSGDASMNAAGGFDESAFVERVTATHREVLERLASEPEVRGVALGDALPRMDHEMLEVEIEDAAGPVGKDPGLFERWVAVAHVDRGFFDGLGQTILQGRGFGPGDVGDGGAVVIVNTAFVEQRLRGRNPIGRRIRFPSGPGDEAAPWLEIVGVVPPLGMNLAFPEFDAGVYFPAAPGEIHPLRLAIHVAGPPSTFVSKLRVLVNEVDPGATVAAPVTLARVYPGEWYFFLATTAGIGILVVVLVAIAISGIYAIMSFGVSERTREIGVRTALGASRFSIAFEVARRSLARMGLGGLIGIPVAAWLFRIAEAGGAGVGASLGTALGVGFAVVALIGLSACFAPARRALGIEPARALKLEG